MFHADAERGLNDSLQTPENAATTRPAAFAALHMVCRRVVPWAVWVPRERRGGGRGRPRVPGRARGCARGQKPYGRQGHKARRWRQREKIRGAVSQRCGEEPHVTP